MYILTLGPRPPWRDALLLLLLASLFFYLPGCASAACETDQECGDELRCEAGFCALAAEPAPVEVGFAVPECPEPSPGYLVLNEVLADPSGVDINGDGLPDPYQDEFVEILNLAHGPVSLEGLQVRVGAKVRYRFPAGCLQTGEAAVVFGGGAAPHLPSLVFVAPEPLVLPNKGTVVSLLGPDGETLFDTLQYGSEADGPASLARVPEGTGAWAVHPRGDSKATVAHSAGRCLDQGVFPNCGGPEDEDLVDPPDCPPPIMGELVVNELLADPGGLDANGDGVVAWQQDEFVELVLHTHGPRDLTSVTVNVNGAPRATLPHGCHTARATFVYFGGGTPSLEAAEDTFITVAEKTLTLPNVGGTVSLVLGDVVLDSVTYGPEGGDDQALTRYPDATGPFVPHTTTPGALLFSPGACSNGAPLAHGCPVPGQVPEAPPEPR